MPRNRKPKKGFVYLLKSTKCKNVYKFGCTTLEPSVRCRRVNTECKMRGYDYSFVVISSVKTNDCYQTEMFIKWNLLDHGVGFLSEKFSIDSIGIDEASLVIRFLEIANGSKK